MNELMGNLFHNMLFARSRFGAWFYVSNESFSFSMSRG